MSADDMITYLARETALIRDLPRPELDENCRRAVDALRRMAELLKQDDTLSPPS